MKSLSRLAVLGALLPMASNAAVIRYVQSAPSAQCQQGEICTAIGVPVPVPIASQTPVAGFRTYTSLIAGLQDLAVQHADVVSFESVGKTAGNGSTQRDIWAFELDTSGNQTVDGVTKSAFLQTGGIHAREWAAPEVVAATMERLLDRRDDGALHEYLLENMRTVLVPVLNVDGFLQTQRYPDRAQQSTCPQDGSADVPRDGRLRRKNMNADGVPVDEDLLTVADSTLGVDANRNNPPWFGGAGSSGTPCSIVYRGIAVESEREVDALQAAAALGPANRLRLYIDTHSFARSYLAANTGNARRDALQQQLAQRMSAAAGGQYGYSASAPGGGIGATDEYFANTYQIPAYTLEIEPSSGGVSEYSGGINVSNSGFILPASEIARVRTQLTNATVLGMYRQAGPPSVARVRITTPEGQSVFSAQWQTLGSSARQLQVSRPQSLQAGSSYVLSVSFNKPMRVRDEAGDVAQYPGQSAALVPTLSLQGIAANGATFSVPISATPDGWRDAPEEGLRYADDTISVTFQVPANTPLSGAKRLSLSVIAADLSGQALDANPATVVDWSAGGWSNYEDANCIPGDSGGADSSVRIVDDGAPLCGAANSDGGGGGGGRLPLGLLIAAVAAAFLREGRQQRSSCNQ
jgi:hypothetical protein